MVHGGDRTVPIKQNFWQISAYFIYLQNVHGIIFGGLWTEVQSSRDTIRCKINNKDEKRTSFKLCFFSVRQKAVFQGEKSKLNAPNLKWSQ